ncbi:ABC transporter ATP-binding protein/permease [Caldovatus aquaticus]|uniref:ABC transporter ATP-binding protein/permease n=1 Tax=Caldovatus aquaticus TaxID=2865671 RepID=A0ABS7EXX7_9PROT|nr:ABC transporter ATP-binding protein/permease [Caldovatus aquaticus]MBW8268209.1 ABC transporter ATP-binding protein/permease [Caldovatus aquaticus]
MADNHARPPANGAHPPPHHGFFRELARLAAPYWRGARRARAWGLTVALALLTVAQVLLAMWVNLWTADLFDALERRSTERFLQQVLVFAAIVTLVMLCNGAHLVVKRRVQLGWREALTADMLATWMDRARHYQIAHVPGDHDNPDGRIAEDIRVTTEAAVDLGHSLLYAAMLLATFVGILWSLSDAVEVAGIPIPGHMVWLALLYAAAGSILAFVFGRPLVRATDQRQGTEADFRFGLVGAREGAEGIALARAEPHVRRRLATLFAAIAASWDRQTVFLGRLTLFSSGYATLAPVFPILVATPRFLAGTITLGTLMQVAQAFQQVTAALSWPVDNFARIAEWRASVERTLGLCHALDDLDAELAEISVGTARIERIEAPHLAVRGLDVANADGTAVATGITLEVAPGERVLITGDPAALAAVFRVLAGIWPWGRGRIERPETDGLAFLGSAPWIPEGTLREALCPPRDDGSAPPPEAALREALERTGLGHLCDRLDEAAAWGKVLSAGERERLGFAQMLLRRPAWIVLHQATDALAPDAEAALLQTLVATLPATTIVSFGRPAQPAELFHRSLTLERASDGTVLIHETRARRAVLRRPPPRVPVLDWMREGFGHRR